MSIGENYQKLREALPANVKIVLAVKKRTPEEVQEVIKAGATDLGHNYVQEAENMINALGDLAHEVNWHMIGHLQSNKINKALNLFSTFHTIDSYKKALALNERVKDGCLNVLIEVDLVNENSKKGFKGDFDKLKEMVNSISLLNKIKLKGLMTMGPAVESPEELRPVFRALRELKEKINGENIPGVKLTELSMGMSDSYQVAIEEGATIVRVGSAVFGARNYG